MSETFVSFNQNGRVKAYIKRRYWAKLREAEMLSSQTAAYMANGDARDRLDEV